MFWKRKSKRGDFRSDVNVLRSEILRVIDKCRADMLVDSAHASLYEDMIIKGNEALKELQQDNISGVVLWLESTRVVGYEHFEDAFLMSKAIDRNYSEN